MAVEDAIQGSQLLTGTIEKNKERTFDLQKMLEEERFRSGESAKERANRVKIAGIEISPAMKHEIEQERIRAKAEAGMSQIADIQDKENQQAGQYRNWTGMMEGQLPSNPSMQIRAEAIRAGLLSGEEAANDIPAEKKLLMLHDQMMAENHPGTRTVLQSKITDMINQMGYLNNQQAKNEALRKAFSSGQAMQSMPVDMNKTMPGVAQAIQGVVPGWNMDEPLYPYLHNTYGKDSAVVEQRLRNAIDEQIKETNPDNPLAVDDAGRAQFATNIFEQLGLKGMRGMRQFDKESLETTTYGQQLTARYIKNPVQKVLGAGSLDRAFNRLAGITGPEYTDNDKYWKTSGEDRGWKPMAANINQAIYMNHAVGGTTPSYDNAGNPGNISALGKALIAPSTTAPQTSAPITQSSAIQMPQNTTAQTTIQPNQFSLDHPVGQ